MDPQRSNNQVFGTSFQRHPNFRRSKRLPVELLVEIFLLSLPPINLSQARQRTALALVCRCWNKIIEGTPILWSRISISDTASYVQRSLRKSAKSPIDVYGKYAYMHVPLSHCAICRQNFREVKRHTERWRCVELLLVHEERGVALVPTSSPFLESVKLISSVKVIADDGYLTLVTSACAPRLRELFLEGVELARWDISFPPTLSHLVLQNIRISLPQILMVFVASPNLTILHLSQLDALERDGGAPDSAPVELASLRKMTFNMTPSNAMRDVMGRLKFPSDCKVSLECEISEVDTRWSFLNPALSRYRETFQRVGEIIQVRIVVTFIGVCVVLRYFHWEIILKLRNRYAIRDTLEWFGISTIKSAATLHMESYPINSRLPPSNIPISLEFDRWPQTGGLRSLDPVFHLECITRMELTKLRSNEYSSILSYLAKPRTSAQPATTTTAGQEPAEINEPTIRRVTQTWPLPGLCELALQRSEDDVLRAVMEFVKGRSFSGMGLGQNLLGWPPIAQVPAELKRVELDGKHDTSPGYCECRVCLRGAVVPWPNTLLDLLEILDEEVQVFWFGKRISTAGIMD